MNQYVFTESAMLCLPHISSRSVQNLWKKENVVLLREGLKSNDGIIEMSVHGRVDEDERCIVKSLP